LCLLSQRAVFLDLAGESFCQGRLEFQLHVDLSHSREECSF
jgi:hypothetical protein